MRALNLVFLLHQPYSLKAPEGGEHEYFGGGADFREANQKYYQPFFALLERNTQRYVGLKVSLLVSGTWLEQAELYEPELVRRLQKLVDLGQVELIATPFYYSLSAFYDKDEFAEQVALFRQKVEGKFGTKCEAFAAPGLMYHDRLAKWAETAGFRGAIAGDGAEILRFRSAGKVYDAAGCENFRVLFEDGRLSRALTRGEDLVMAESLQAEKATETADDENMEELSADGGTRGLARAFVGARKRATAAEFVRGRAGLSATVTPRGVAAGSSGSKAGLTAGKKMYSAKKLQKELDMACLRGNLISLCLDARMFGAHREEGVVACFDEFFMNWLRVPGNKFLTVSEALTDFAPTAEISIKTTVKSRGMLTSVLESSEVGASSAAMGLARVEEVQYTLPEEFRASSEDKLYELRERVLKTKNEDLRRDFQKLTTLDYVLHGDFEKVVEDFEARVDDLLPKPKQLREKNEGEADEDAGEANLTASRRADELNGVTGEEEAEPEDDYTVKVHRILKKADQEQRVLAGERTFELESGASDAEDGDALGGAEFVHDNPIGDDSGKADDDFEDDFSVAVDFEGLNMGDDEADDAGIIEDEDSEDGAEEAEDAEDVMDAFDAAEAEVQVIAQRMKRSRQTAEREFDALMEAEVVSVASGTKGASDDLRENDDSRGGGFRGIGAKRKKTHRRIVLD